MKPLMLLIFVLGGVFLLSFLASARCRRRWVIVPLIVIGMFAAVGALSRAPAPVRFAEIQTPAPWASRLQSQRLQRSATETAPWVLESVAEPNPVATHPTGKLWVDDWAAYVSTAGARQRMLRAESPQYAPTDDEARASAQENAVQLLLPYVSSRPSRQSGIRVLPDMNDPQLASMILAALRGGGGLVIDEQLERIDRPYGQVWRARLLLDASSPRIDRIISDYRKVVASNQKRELTTWASLAIMLGIVVLLYFFLNAATKGYFVWKLRAAAAMIVIVAVLAAVSNMRM